jgi:hypothetical protein
MKYLILLLLSLNAYAIRIPHSEAVKAVNLEPNAGSKTCEMLPSEPCYEFNGLWQAAELVDNVVPDYVAKLNEVSCVKGIATDPVEGEEPLPFNEYQDCDDKFLALACAEGEAIKNYDQLQVYCAKQMYKVDGKKLVENEAKKATYEKSIKDAEKAEADLKLKKIQDKASAKAEIGSANNVATLKAAMLKYLNSLE